MKPDIAGSRRHLALRCCRALPLKRADERPNERQLTAQTADHAPPVTGARLFRGSMVTAIGGLVALAALVASSLAPAGASTFSTAERAGHRRARHC
jgi:hypothetical protein